MSTPRPPDPAKLVISVFMGEKQTLDRVFPLLEEMAGPVDLMSAWLDFDFTRYYDKEMGSPLFRRILAFKPLVDPAGLSSIKLATNAIEQRFSRGAARQINIDPGYLLSSRFILATGKDYAHRIYIGQQIYADLTLIYTRQGFKPLDWTYPDYASDKITRFLAQVRHKYLLDLKQEKGKER